MSELNHTRKPLSNGADRITLLPAEISCVFKFGKDHHHDQLLINDDLAKFEIEKDLDQPADHLTLNTAAATADILRIKNQLKLSSSLQVHSSDGSLISVFNTDPLPSSSSSTAPATYTNLETSFDLPLGVPSFIEEICNQTSPFPDIDFEHELFKDLLTEEIPSDPLLNSHSEMPNQSNPFDQPIASVALSSNHASSSHFGDSMMDEEQSSSAISHISEESVSEPPIRRKRTTKTKDNAPVSAAGKLARFGNKQVVKYSNEYHDRRLKNNEAVKKSRLKAKEKQKSTESQMSKLTEENRRLHDRLEVLSKELEILRSLCMRRDMPNKNQV